jgi:organic radical activating enzyme
MNSTKLTAIWPGENRFVNIVWQVSDVCNFRCSYCNPGNWGGQNKNLDVKKYVEILDKIITHFQDRNYVAFKFFFSGGEPTFWPPLIEICKFIYKKTKNPTLAINTNLSRPLRWWKENHHYFHDVVASFHVEGTNKDRYMENVEYLQYRMSYLALRMLMHDERFSEVVDFSEFLKSRLDNYLIEYAALFEALLPHSEMHYYKDKWKRDFLSTKTVETQKKVLFSRLDRQMPAYCMTLYEDGCKEGLNSNQIVLDNNNLFKGWKCWIDESIFISPNGNIRLASCNAGKIIGNINYGIGKLTGKPITCPEERCNCGTDINIPKIRPDSEKLIRKAFDKNLWP